MNPYVERTENGWITKGDPLLQQFFSRSGYWSSYEEDCQGMNEIDWESRGDKVVFTNWVTEQEAIIEKTDLLETIALLHQWNKDEKTDV